MRLTFSAAAVVIVLLCAGSRAEARPRSAADDAQVTRLLAHADAIASILEKDLDRPKKALGALDKYLKKHRKPMKALIGKLVVAAGELDDDARSSLARDLMWSERTQRFLAALTEFKDKHEGDPAYAKKIDVRMQELVREGKKLVDALMQ
jgi:triphosphoribosyl-dephospho-CoA synthetase